MTAQNAQDFPIWKTIRIGTFKDAETIRKAIEEKGSELGCGIGEHIMGGSWHEHNVALIVISESKFFVTDQVKEIDLVLVSGRELLGDEWRPSTQIYSMVRNAAKYCGLEDCPPEIGPMLYLSSVDEQVCVGMEPIFASHTFTNYCAFKVTPTMLGVYHTYPWIHLDTKVVFVRPR